eukprot:1162012-Pelagomonas_calceolata.AAC.3
MDGSEGGHYLSTAATSSSSANILGCSAEGVDRHGGAGMQDARAIRRQCGTHRLRHPLTLEGVFKHPVRPSYPRIGSVRNVQSEKEKDTTPLSGWILGDPADIRDKGKLQPWALHSTHNGTARKHALVNMPHVFPPCLPFFICSAMGASIARIPTSPRE